MLSITLIKSIESYRTSLGYCSILCVLITLSVLSPLLQRNSLVLLVKRTLPVNVRRKEAKMPKCDLEHLKLFKHSAYAVAIK